MSSLKTFFKFRFRYTTGLGQLRFLLQSGSGGIAKFILGILLALFLLLCLGFVYIVMAVLIQMTACSLGQPELMPEIMLSAVQILLFITGLFSAFNMMFGGNDREFMASLPIKGKYIFLVNIFMAYLTELATAALFILPIIVIYGIFNGMSLTLWLYGILGIVLFPVFPLCLASVIMLLVMMATGRLRHKELLITVFSFLLLAAVFLGNVYLNSGSANSVAEEDFMESFMNGKAELISTVSYILPGAGLLSGALTSGGTSALLYFLGLIAVEFVPGAICIWLGNRYYFDVLRRLSYAAVKKKTKLSRKDFHAGSPVKAMFMKEWKLALRSPVYAVNGLFNIIIGPVLVVFMFLSGGDTDNAADMLTGILERHPSAAVAVITGAVVFVGGMGMISSTTISREGPSFWICKTIPVPVRAQMKGRLLAGCSMYFICAVLMLIAFRIFVPLSTEHMIAAAVLSLAAGPGLTSLQMMPDIARPKLIWNQEKDAMKQNVNGMLAMLFALVLAVMVVVPIVLAAVKLMPMAAGYIIAFVICAAAAVGGIAGMFKLAETRFARTW